MLKFAVFSILLIVNINLNKIVSSSGFDNGLSGFDSDKVLFKLRASQEGEFARYQPAIKLNNLNLENDHFSDKEVEPSSSLPVVVVAIPTFNRQQFLLQSLEYVRRQQYPRNRIQVAILDDSLESIESDEDFEDQVERLNKVGIKVHYKHRTIIPELGQENIGQKRNSIVRWIKRDLIESEQDFVIIHWDDDDWHAPHRIMKQVLPLINGQSDISALDLHTILLLNENRVYSRWAPDGKKTPMPIMSVNGGTLCYWASVWNDNDIKFPNLGCGEDIMFVDRAMNAYNRTKRVTILDDSEISVIYMRHEGNTWSGLDKTSWMDVPSKHLPPRFRKDIQWYNGMKSWKKMPYNGGFQKNEEHWHCSSTIDQVNTLVVNEIRGITK